MLAQSLFWTDSLANQTLTVIWQGCSNKTDLRKTSFKTQTGSFKEVKWNLFKVSLNTGEIFFWDL